MDKFAATTALIGFALLCFALFIIIHSALKIIDRKARIKGLLFSLIIFLMLIFLSTAFISFSLFIQTFSILNKEELIGKVAAKKSNDNIKMQYFDVKRNKEYNFNLTGDQWMVEGYILRWKPTMRWFGAGAYYKVSRFRGRWEPPREKIPTEFVIQPEVRSWKFLLTEGEKIPFVDSAYGIGAFQYPSEKTFYLYITDSGFVLKNH